VKPPKGRRRVACSIEIDAPVGPVFARWADFEQLPRLMDGVRRTQRIGEHRVLWDADISGRQVVWEAEIVESVPEKRIRWQSVWGAAHAGEVAFDPLPGNRTLVTVDITYRPNGLVERLGARLGFVKARIQGDLARFRRGVEISVPDRRKETKR